MITETLKDRYWKIYLIRIPLRKFFEPERVQGGAEKVGFGKILVFLKIKKYGIFENFNKYQIKTKL